MQTLNRLAVLAVLAGLATQANAQTDAQQSCEALAEAAISADSVRLPIGGVTLTSAVYVPAADWAVAVIPRRVRKHQAASIRSPITTATR